MDIKEIKQIVDLMKKSDLTEFGVEEENFKLQIKRASANSGQPSAIHYAPAPLQSISATPAPVEAPAAPVADTSTYITSPMVGTFYSSPSPESPAFISVGDSVQADSVVCIIEAMKIMNEIQSEKVGSVAEMLVANGDPVEFGQRLFRLA